MVVAVGRERKVGASEEGVGFCEVGWKMKRGICGSLWKPLKWVLGVRDGERIDGRKKLDTSHGIGSCNHYFAKGERMNDQLITLFFLNYDT